MSQRRVYTLDSWDGRHKIRVREHMPEGEPVGILLISHGIAEHAARYDNFAEYMADRGFIVAAHDHRGHGEGLSEEDTGFFAETNGWELTVCDIRTLLEAKMDENPGLPVFLLGHSMGSFLVRTYVIRYLDGLSGLILSGTGQQSRATVRSGLALAEGEIRRYGVRYKSKLLNDLCFGRFNTSFDISRSTHEWLSRDEEQVDLFVQDELCGFIPSTGLVRDMLGGIDFISRERNLQRMNKELPVIFLSGSNDPVGEMGRGVMRAYDSFIRAGCTDCTLKLYPGARHEILNETNRAQVYDDIYSWIERRLLSADHCPEYGDLLHH